MTSDDQELKIMTWILECVNINKGYGVSRLSLRIKEKFPGSKWSEGKINNHLGRHDHREGTNLLELISVDDNSKSRKPFQDPDNVYLAEDIAEKENRKIISYEGNEDREYGSLTDSKHKVAYTILKRYGDTSEDYYSGGSTVTLRYWMVLAQKLGINLPRKNTKSNIVKLIFENCQIEFDEVSNKYTSKGGTVTKFTFITLADHLGIKLPANLVDEPDDDDDFHVSLHSVDPIVDAKTITIRELVDQYSGGRIYSPSFQRNFRWPIKKQRELIDSILLGIPLPSILLIRASDGDWWLVDGRQRVTTLRRFIKPKDSRNSFHLGQLDGSTQLHSSKYFNDLDTSVQNRILETNVPVTYIEGLSDHKSAIYELFRRYNTGGTNLNGAEIRHAVFHENEVHKELFKLAGEDRDVTEFNREIKETRTLIRIANKNTTGFKAYDRICRYFGYKYSPKGGTTSNSIFKFFEDRNGIDSDEAIRYKEEFIDCVRFSGEIFGNDLRFSRLKEDQSSGGFGAWPYTVQMIGAAHLKEKYPDSTNLILKKKYQIRDRWKEFYKNEIFNVRQNSTTLWDSQEMWCNILDQMLDGKGKNTEYEFMVRELFETERSLRKEMINSLKDKKYYEKLVKKAVFEGWL